MSEMELIFELAVLQRELATLSREAGLTPILRWRLYELRAQLLRLIAEKGEGVT